MNDKEFCKADDQRKADGMSEEDRIDFLLNSLEVEYDGFIDDHREHMRKELNRNVIYAILGLVVIVVFVYVGFHFDLYTIGSVS